MKKKRVYGGNCGELIYAPKPLMNLSEIIQKENNIKKGESLRKITEYAYVGKEMERMLKKVRLL